MIDSTILDGFDVFIPNPESVTVYPKTAENTFGTGVPFPVARKKPCSNDLQSFVQNVTLEAETCQFSIWIYADATYLPKIGDVVKRTDSDKGDGTRWTIKGHKYTNMGTLCQAACVREIDTIAGP